MAALKTELAKDAYKDATGFTVTFKTALTTDTDPFVNTAADQLAELSVSKVTVISVNGSLKFALDGIAQDNLVAIAGETYLFDISDPSLY